jgi:hypothetical protein
MLRDTEPSNPRDQVLESTVKSFHNKMLCAKLGRKAATFLLVHRTIPDLGA